MARFIGVRDHDHPVSLLCPLGGVKEASGPRGPACLARNRTGTARCLVRLRLPALLAISGPTPTALHSTEQGTCTWPTGKATPFAGSIRPGRSLRSRGWET